MDDRPKESDWRAFRDRFPGLRERYLEKRNSELIEILGDETLSPTERFWNLEKRAGEIAKVLVVCLDGHSRSKMERYMRLMHSHGLLSDDDLEGFSEELRARILWKPKW